MIPTIEEIRAEAEHQAVHPGEALRFMAGAQLVRDPALELLAECRRELNRMADQADWSDYKIARAARALLSRLPPAEGEQKCFCTKHGNAWPTCTICNGTGRVLHAEPQPQADVKEWSNLACVAFHGAEKGEGWYAVGQAIVAALNAEGE